MKQLNIEKADQSQTNEQQVFFDTEAVQTAHPVVPLAQLDTTANTNNYFRVPVRPANSRFSPLMPALILLPAMIIFAGIGTVFYNSQTKNNSKGVPEINETVIQAEQINVEPPAAKPAPIVSKNTLTQPSKKASENKADVEDSPNTDDSIPLAVILDELGRNVDFEKIGKEQDEDDAPEIKRERKENKKQEKLERKNKRENRQNRDSEKNSDDDDDN